MNRNALPTVHRITSTALVAALAAAGLLGAGAGAFVVGNHAHAAVPAMPSSTASVAGAAAPRLPGSTVTPDFAQIARRYGTAVVNITVSGMRKVAADDGDDGDEGDDAAPSRGRVPQLDPNTPLFEFFRHFGGPQGFQMPREMPMRGQGSGFIVSADGVILTNAHVVRDAKNVSVKLTDRREFEATVLGSDPKTDIAVLKIDAKDLPTVPLGSARDLQVGQWVLAIGSPFGFENSVTAGVVSAKGRSLPDDSFVPFIQTDVAVNPGNSGGPLFNAQGEVVGINSQIFSRSGGYQGLSFAIPIDLAVRVKDQIVATGHVTHARLGVAIQDVNQALADSFRLERPEGALVSSVDPGSAADKAGLKSGDVILRVDGQPIAAAGDLPALIGQAAPGDRVALEVWRQGRTEKFDARLGKIGEKSTQLARGEAAAGQGRLGLALRPLLPQEQRQAHVEGGLRVEQASGAAALAGVQPGDLLIGIDGKPVQSVEQVREVLAKSGKSVALLIQRDGHKIFMPVRIG
ncbi:MAG: peptidase [Rubrivivax sp. SCN 71-131]|nr:MAG: peptidase [Rubrivivax sp. SCN 71-131]